MTTRGLYARAQALLRDGHVRLQHAGAQHVTADCLAYPSAALRQEGWTEPRTWRVTWEPGGWRCECWDYPRHRTGPCPHLLAVHGLLAAVDPAHPGTTDDPWSAP